MIKVTGTNILNFQNLIFFSGFREHMSASKSNTISCGLNKIISIQDLNVESITTIVTDYKPCNLTEEQSTAIKTGCDGKKSCNISSIVQNICLFNDEGHVSVSYLCTGKQILLNSF